MFLIGKRKPLKPDATHDNVVKNISNLTSIFSVYGIAGN